MLQNFMGPMAIDEEPAYPTGEPAPLQAVGDADHPQQLAASSKLQGKVHEVTKALGTMNAVRPNSAALSQGSTSTADEAPGDTKKKWKVFSKALKVIYFGEVDESDAKPYSLDDLQEGVYWYEMLDPKARPNATDKDAELMKINKHLTIELVRQEWVQLREDRQEILLQIRSKFDELREAHKHGYSRFQVSGKGSGSMCEVLLVPKDMSVTPYQMKETLGSKCWRKEAPDKLVKFDFGARHCAALATQLLQDTEGYKPLKKAAEEAVSMQLEVECPGTKEDMRKSRQPETEEFRRRVNTMMNCLLRDFILDVMTASLNATFM
jgi:hypothetical protein